MPHQLIIDIGNSSAKVALFEETALAEHIHAEHDELPQLLSTMAAGHPTLECAILSSVIPLTSAMQEAIEGLPFPCLLMSSNLQMPFSIAYKTPETLGPDRLAAAAEAWGQQPGHNLLVIDMGTAITYDLVTAEGEYLGGNIAPGISMRFKALNHFTGKLPLVSKAGRRATIGDTTETAIREGVLQGVNYEIEGYIRECSNKFPNLLVFLTGGDAKFLDNQTKSRTFADGLLVIKGLNRILTLNK